MQTKAFLRSLVAISVAATISACGDNGEDAATLLEQQLAAEQAIEQQEQATEDSIAGSSGTDPLPPTSPEPSTTESLTIAVPGGTDYSTGAYPWNPEGATKFWYGLDEHEVVVPEASVANNVYHLTFAGEYHPETGEAGPGAELQEVLWEKTGDVTIVLPEGTFKMNDQLRVDFSLDEYAGITSITIMGHGIDKTILSYTEAADAVSDSVHFSVAKDIEIAHFTVVDSSKNAILVDESDGVYMHHLGAIWPGKPDKDNGAYGLYPVESDNVIMEDSFSFGSACYFFICRHAHIFCDDKNTIFSSKEVFH